MNCDSADFHGTNQQNCFNDFQKKKDQNLAYVFASTAAVIRGTAEIAMLPSSPSFNLRYILISSIVFES